MKVISTNLGKPTRFIWKGKEVQTGIFKKPVVEPLHLNIHEVTNDTVVDRKHHAGVDKACYLFSQEDYDFWKPKYPNLKWERCCISVRFARKTWNLRSYFRNR